MALLLPSVCRAHLQCFNNCSKRVIDEDGRRSKPHPSPLGCGLKRFLHFMAHWFGFYSSLSQNTMAWSQNRCWSISEIFLTTDVILFIILLTNTSRFGLAVTRWSRLDYTLAQNQAPRSTEPGPSLRGQAQWVPSESWGSKQACRVIH